MLKEQIEADKLIIKNAKENLYKAQREFNSIERPLLEKYKQILDKFKLIINLKMKAEHLAENPCGCGSPNYYREAYFTEKGICLWIDADHPNDISEDH
jgi:hypothetical protein